MKSTLFKSFAALIVAVVLLYASGVAPAAYNLVMQSAVALTRRSTINFTGAGVTCTDDAGNSRTNCTVPGGTPSDLGVVTWNNGGTCTFAAASTSAAGATLATVHGESCTLSPTNLVKWGTYTLVISQDATGGGATLTLGIGGSCSAWKVTGGGSGAIVLSVAANAQDTLAFSFDGTNCCATMYPNQN